jgi:hypothetical protein
MTLVELGKKLLESHFPDHSYSLDGSTPKYADGAFILNLSDGLWIIEYIERGVRREKARYQDEAAACDEFYRLMKRSM